MYNGWIKCSEKFQRMSGFKYKEKQQCNNGDFKYLNVRVIDIQYKGMVDNWEKFKSSSIEWDLKKKVNEVNGLSEGEVVLKLLNHDNYFFYRYDNLKHFSKLKEWKEYNGIYDISLGKYIEEGYLSTVSHIKKDGSTYETHTKWIENDVKSHGYDLHKLHKYMKELNGIRDMLFKLNDVL